MIDYWINTYTYLCIQPTSNIPYSQTAVLMAFNILSCQNMLSLKAAIIKKKWYYQSIYLSIFMTTPQFNQLSADWNKPMLLFWQFCIYMRVLI